jgi:hypothetical protein
MVAEDTPFGRFAVVETLWWASLSLTRDPPQEPGGLCLRRQLTSG